MQVGAASWIASAWIASVALALAACNGGEQAPSCTIGQPCEIVSGGGTVDQGNPCRGETATDNGKPFCSCTCAAAFRTDAGAGDSGIADAASSSVCGSGPPYACNSLANIGSMVTPACVAGAPPAMSGGAIADGTYVLVAATAYAPSCAAVSLSTGGPTTLQILGGCLQSTDITGGAQTSTFTTSGTTLSIDEVCPASNSYALGYTATATTLSEVGPSSTGTSVVSVFHKH